MSEIKSLFDELKSSNEREETTKLLSVLTAAFAQGSAKPDSEDLSAIDSFVKEELEKLITVIPDTTDHEKADELFGYADKLMGLFTFVNSQNFDVSESEFKIVETVVGMINNRRVLENAIDKAFESGNPSDSQISDIIELVKSSDYEYQRGKLFAGLLYHKDKLGDLSASAKTVLARYAAEEMERLIKAGDGMTDKHIDSLEIAADVCKYFADNGVINALYRSLELKRSNIAFYAAESLLHCGKTLENYIVEMLARDNEYASLAYKVLCRYGKQSMFPPECATPEYLAKSDMIRWLVYPTELGKAPDAIELMGTTKAHGSIYRIFKYKSDSANLGDELKNKWLIGWSSEAGDTFSNFDLLEGFECKTEKKTLKLIKKRLLK